MRAPILYSFRRCPYAMRARLALQASGTTVELREVVLKDKPAELLQASPKGTVPVLLLPDDRVLEQILDTMLWALLQRDPEHWLPLQSDWQDAMDCIALNDGAFKHALDRYKYPGRYGLSDGSVHRQQGAETLQRWETRLGEQPFLNGPHWGLLDAAIAPFVRQFAHTDPAWFAAQAWPQLQAWLAAFEASPAFAGVMHKVPVWQAGDAPCLTRFATDL